MKRSYLLPSAFFTALTFALFATTPALAQTGTEAEDAIGALFGSSCCIGILVFSLAFWAFNIWMLVDAIARNDWEYPNNNKTLWVVLLIVGIPLEFGWIVAIFYYFGVFKKVRRGSMAGPQAPVPYGSPPPVRPTAPVPPAPVTPPPAPPAAPPMAPPAAPPAAPPMAPPTAPAAPMAPPMAPPAAPPMAPPTAPAAPMAPPEAPSVPPAPPETPPSEEPGPLPPRPPEDDTL